MADSVYVIIREVGADEYRYRDPIRYVLTKEEAIAACKRAVEEGKTVATPPYPTLQPLIGPDVVKIEAENERARQAYYAACRALNCVDPDGPNPHARYLFAEVQWMPSAARVRASAH